MICSKCNLEKGEDFRKCRKVCRECDNEIARENRKKKKFEPKPEFIVCNKCGKQTSEFRNDGRKSCIDCERARGREYRKRTDTAKIWTENNRERMSELQANWFQKNKEKINNKTLLRLKEDENFALAVKHRASICRLIYKSCNTSKYLNCNGDRLRNWIQFQFTLEMNFDNYSDIWTIDHVIPIYYFLKGEIPSSIILNWINVRPCLKKENLTRNKYYNEKECLKHLETVKSYYKIRNLEPDNEYISALEKIIENDLCDNFAKHLDAGSSLEP